MRHSLFVDSQQPGGGQNAGGAPPPASPYQPQLPSPAELGLPTGQPPAPPSLGQPAAPAPQPQPTPAQQPAQPAGQPPAPRTYQMTEEDIQRLVAAGVQQFMQRQPPAAGQQPGAPPPPPAGQQPAQPTPPPQQPAAPVPAPAPPAPTPPPAVDPGQEALRNRQLELERELNALREEQKRTQREKEVALQQAAEGRVQQAVLSELVSADIGLSQIAANKAYAELKASGRIRPHTDNQVYVVLPDEHGVERTHYLKDGLRKWMQTSDGLFYKGAVPAGAGSTPSSVGSMPNLAGSQNGMIPEMHSSAAAAARNLEHDLRLMGQLPPGPRG